MLKKLLAILVLSILVIIGLSYAHQILTFLLNAHDKVNELLQSVFSEDKAGDLIKNLLALLAVPFGFGLVSVIAYWVVKRQWFPYFMDVVWILWLVQTAALIALYKTSVGV